MLLDREVEVDHTTIFRWIQTYAVGLEKRIRPHLRMSNSFYPPGGNLLNPAPSAFAPGGLVGISGRCFETRNYAACRMLTDPGTGVASIVSPAVV